MLVLIAHLVRNISKDNSSLVDHFHSTFPVNRVNGLVSSAKFLTYLRVIPTTIVTKASLLESAELSFRSCQKSVTANNEYQMFDLFFSFFSFFFTPRKLLTSV